MLKAERDLSFEMVLQAMEDDCLLDVLEHHNKEKYGGQKLYVIKLDGYAYIVPFEDNGDERILKTIFPSRRYTRLYISTEEN